MHRFLWLSEIQIFIKSQLSAVDSKNNYFLEPSQPPFKDMCHPKNSFATITKMGPQNDTKNIEMTSILSKTSFTLISKEIQMCSDLLRVRTLVRKYCKSAIYLAEMVFDFRPNMSYQKSSIHCK